MGSKPPPESGVQTFHCTGYRGDSWKSPCHRPLIKARAAREAGRRQGRVTLVPMSASSLPPGHCYAKRVSLGRALRPQGRIATPRSSTARVIGQPIGTVMKRYQPDEDRAFQYLARCPSTATSSCVRSPRSSAPRATNDRTWTTDTPATPFRHASIRGQFSGVVDTFRASAPPPTKPSPRLGTTAHFQAPVSTSLGAPSTGA